MTGAVADPTLVSQGNPHQLPKGSSPAQAHYTQPRPGAGMWSGVPPLTPPPPPPPPLQVEIGAYDLPPQVQAAATQLRIGYICQSHQALCTGSNVQVRTSESHHDLRSRGRGGGGLGGGREGSGGRAALPNPPALGCRMACAHPRGHLGESWWEEVRSHQVRLQTQTRADRTHP
jgi:hypothetical protein